MVAAHNEVVDVNEGQAETICKLQLKVADLEDRSRNNNITIWGIPETLKNQEIISYLKLLFLKLLPDLSPRDLLMDHAHRIPKPAYVPDTVPRDVLTRVHYYHIKPPGMHTSFSICRSVTLSGPLSSHCARKEGIFPCH